MLNGKITNMTTLSFEETRTVLRNAAETGETQELASLFEAFDDQGRDRWTLAEHVELGNLLMTLKLFPVAEDAFAAIRLRWPDDPAGWRGGALVAARLANWEQCEARWMTCLDLCPPETLQQWWLASYLDVLFQTGNTDHATSVAEMLCKRWPDHPLGWRGGAQLAVKRRAWAEAANLWRACLARMPEAEQPIGF